MPTTDYTNANLTIVKMVYNRLPFFTETNEHTALIKDFVYEIMWELEICLKIAQTVDPADNTRIGQETYYNVLQMALIADLTALYILMWIASGNSNGTNANVTANFLKRAKAGSAEVEFEAYKAGNGSFVTSLATMTDFYKSRAINKAWQMGCHVEICDDCSMKVGCGCTDYAALPILVAKKSCC